MKRVPVICPVRNSGTDPFDDRDAKTWPWIVFQVMWSPVAGCSCPEETVVLLGEAFAPRVNTIPGRRTPLSLPLKQTGRRPLEGCQSYEYWLNKIWPDYQYRIWQEKESDRRKSERNQRRASLKQEAEQRRASLRATEPEASEDDDAKAHAKGNWEDAAEYLSPEEMIIKAWKERSEYLENKSKEKHYSVKGQAKAHEFGTVEGSVPPVKLADGTIAYTPQLPVKFTKSTTAEHVDCPHIRANHSAEHSANNSGIYKSEVDVHDPSQCIIDVDLAWTTEYGERENDDDEDERDDDDQGRQVFGYLMIYSLSVRVPPCNEGQLRIRVAQVEAVAAASAKPTIPNDVGATDTSRSLCAQLMEKDARITPVAPPAKKLWQSREKTLGTQEHKCMCDWGTEAFVKLEVTQCKDLKKQRRRHMIDDMVESCLPPKKSPPKRRECAFTYSPVRLRQPVPMPRGDFVMMPEALFEQPARVPASEADFTAPAPRRVGSGINLKRSESAGVIRAGPTNWIFDPPCVDGDRRSYESRNPRGLGRAGNSEGMSAPMFRSASSGGLRRLIGDAAFLRSTGGHQQLRI